MPRSSRKRFGVGSALLVGLLLPSPRTSWAGAHGSADAQEPTLGESLEAGGESRDTYGATLEAYIEALGRLRQGHDGAREELLRLAHRLCSQHARCDALAVARFYAALTPGDLAQGAADEAAFLELREAVVEAGQTAGALGPDGESWPERRERVSASLEELARTVERRPDVTPAARAHALLARLQLGRVEAGDDDQAVRSQLIASARRHVARSIELFQRAGQVTPRLEPLWVRGRLSRALDNREDARADFEACRELALAVGRDAYRERALLGLVDLAKDVGDLAQVDRLLAQVATFRNPRDSWPLAREHASRLIHADRGEVALAFLLAHPPHAGGYHDQWRGLLAVALLRTGDIAGARRELADLSDGTGEFARLARATVALAEGRAEEVLLDLADDFSIDRWSRQGRTEAATLVGEAWLDRGDPLSALPRLEAALDEARLRESPALRSGSIVGEWVGLHAVTLLARAHAELGDGLAAAVVVEEHQSRRLRAPHTRVDRGELLAWAARFDRGLVTWAIGADASVVAVVAPDGESWAEVIPLGRRAIASAVRRLREVGRSGDASRAHELAAEMVTALFPTAVRQILTEGAAREDRALFLLHGPLEGLPLSLLEFDGELLDERLTPLVLPGLPAAGDETAALTPDVRWNLMGSPLAGGGEPLLPGAARELAHLAQVYPQAFVTTGTTFVRDALEAALQGSSPLHVATHLVRGPRCGDGRLSPVGLLLSNGEVLCAERILDLEPRLPLVVLTACETAGGRVIDAEGAHGVGRAFLEGGTRNLLVTLWPVEDEAARRFSLAFHGFLLEGATPSAAARNARRNLRAEGFPSRDWAAFRLMGRD